MLLHHIALGARDVETVAAFYRRWFELEEITRHQQTDGSLRSIWLRLGGAILMVERTAEGPRAVEGVGAGPFLLAFNVKEMQTIGARTADERRRDYYRGPYGVHLVSA